MPRSNIARKMERQRQTRLNYKPASLSNDISTYDNRKSKSLISVEISSPCYFIDNDTESEDFQVSSKPSQSEKKSLKSVDKRVINPRVVLPKSTGKPDKVGIESNLGQDRIKFKSQTFGVAYNTYKERIIGRDLNYFDSSDGSEADDADVFHSHELTKLKVGNANLCKGYRRNGILSDESEAFSNHAIEGNKEEISFLASTNSPRRKSSFGAYPSQKPKSETIILYSSSDDDPIVISATKPKVFSHQEISPHKRRRVLTRGLKQSPDLATKSPINHYSESSLNDSDVSEDIISPIKRHRHMKRNEKNLNLESSSTNENSSQRSLLKHNSRRRRIKKCRNDKDKALELMRRRRAGEVIDKLTSSESTSSDEDADDKFEVLSVFEDEDEDDDGDGDDGREKVDSPNSRTTENEMQANDSDFVVDDGESTLGIPNHMTFIPLHLTHTAHKPLKEHFRDAVEWLVKNMICPKFARDDEIYLQAFRKLDDVCLGLAKSKFISTQWTPAFTRAIWTRPYLICGPLLNGEGYEPKTGLPKCDACNHRKHIPISFIQFKGKAYDKLTLVQTDQESESDQECSKIKDYNQSRDCHPRTKQWFVGSTCKKNAQCSHSLIHWKYALNEWVIDALSHEGYLSSDMVAERERMEPKKADQYTNKIIDSWETKGLIKILYQDWKNQRNLAIVGLKE